MRLVSYDGGFGRIEGDHVVPMGADLVAWLAGAPSTDGVPMPLDATVLRAPVRRPGKIIGVGLNYRDHARETGMALPSVPVLFAKYANSVVGPDDDVVVPPGVTGVDYEAELGVVIGRTTSHVDESCALEHVAGYVAVNDVSSRDLQFATPQWLYGKAIDTFLPMGPWLLTADEVPDPQALVISCTVNGELRQSSSTAEMAFSVAQIVSFLSQVMTLEPGDVIATGTPAGVGMGFDPPKYLSPGDVMTVRVEHLGELTNRVVAAEH